MGVENMAKFLLWLRHDWAENLFLTASEFGLTYVGLKWDETVSPIFSFYPHRMFVHDPKRLAP